MGVGIKGLQRVQKRLEEIGKFDKNTREMLVKIANVAKNEITLAFENEKSPFGSQWSELEDSTKKQKEKLGYGNKKKLYREGDLTARWVIVPKGNNAVRLVSSARSGLDFAYGLVHQYGTNKAGRKRNTKIKARPFLPIHKEKISEPLKKAIQKAKKEILKSSKR